MFDFQAQAITFAAFHSMRAYLSLPIASLYELSQQVVNGATGC